MTPIYLPILFQRTPWPDDVIKNMPTHMRIHRTQRVIQHIHIRITIHRPRQTHSLLLTARQVNSFFADFSRVARFEDVQVG